MINFSWRCHRATFRQAKRSINSITAEKVKNFTSKLWQSKSNAVFSLRQLADPVSCSFIVALFVYCKEKHDSKKKNEKSKQEEKNVWADLEVSFFKGNFQSSFVWRKKPLCRFLWISSHLCHADDDECAEKSFITRFYESIKMPFLQR